MVETPDERAAFELWLKDKRREARAERPAFTEAPPRTMIGRRNA